MIKTYSIANDTLNGAVGLSSLRVEIETSTITVALESIKASGDVLEITFKAALGTNAQTELTTIVNNHMGVELDIPENVEAKITSEPPFMENKEGVFTLYTKIEGAAEACDISFDVNGLATITNVEAIENEYLLAAGATKTLLLTVPYGMAAWNGTDIVGGGGLKVIEAGVLDSDLGAYTGFPSARLNYYVHNMRIEIPHYEYISSYKANVYAGMELYLTIKNIGSVTRNIGSNFFLHEKVTE
jgi:hypothetical protein